MWEWKYDFARLFLPWGKFKSLILLCLALSQSKYWCRALSASQTYSSATMLLWLIQMCSSISESYLESKPWTRDAGGLPLPVLAGRLRWYLSQLTRWHQRVKLPIACCTVCHWLCQLACLLTARQLNTQHTPILLSSLCLYPWINWSPFIECLLLNIPTPSSSFWHVGRHNI